MKSIQRSDVIREQLFISTGIFDRKYFYDAEHDLVAIDS